MRTFSITSLFILLLVRTLYGQVITGNVTNAFTRQPIDSVNVIGYNKFHQITNIKTITDSLGNYRIKIDSLCFSLSFWRSGYVSDYISILGNTNFNIALNEESITLHTVIIKDFVIRTSPPIEIPRRKQNNKRKWIADSIYYDSIDTIIMHKYLEKVEKNRLFLKSIDKKRINDSINSIVNIPDKDEQELRNYIIKTIEYPETAINNGIEGNVYARFTINEKGVIDRIGIIRDVDSILNNEVLRVLNNMPQSIQIGLGSGKYIGKRVSINYTIPIYFRIEEIKNNT